MGRVKRTHVVQQAPSSDLDLTGFPERRLAADTVWFRQHRMAQRPWWFSSVGPDRPSGRFDLSVPRGTCYLASSAEAAVRELVGPDFASSGRIPSSVIDHRVVSRLVVPQPVRAAQLDDQHAAAYRVTRELATMTPYDIPQAWAAALDSAGFDGILSPLRFTPGDDEGLALFGPAGDPGWLGDPDPESVLTVGQRLNFTPIGPPSADEMTWIK
jgi:hypothetical protein